MKPHVLIASLVVALSMLVSATARADQPFAEPQPASAATPLQRKEEAEDRAFRAFVVGSLTAAVPFSVGTMVTTSSHEQDAQNAGVYTLQGGLLVAPLVSHAMLGEWKRGLLFSIAPLAGSGSMVALLAVHPDAVSHAALDVQRMYYFMVVASVLGGGIGVVDTLFHPSREALREPVRPPGSLGSLRVSPILSPGNYGLSVGGAL